MNRYRHDLAVPALPQELESAARLAVRHLQTEAARLIVRARPVEGSRLPIEVDVENLTGHKLPTAYPFRRVWIHLVVRDGGGRPVFESGEVVPSGAIRGNDNDTDPLTFEPHRTRITDPDQRYDAAESQRFVRYFDSMSRSSSEVLARAEITVAAQ